MNKFENLPDYERLFPIACVVLNVCHSKYPSDCCAQSPWLQDANVGSSGAKFINHRMDETLL